MKRHILLSIAAAHLLCCSGRAASESIRASSVPSTNYFSLACTVESDTLKCVLRNATTNTIQYSSYTIGYYEAIILEQYDAVADSWHEVPWRDTRLRLTKGIGASTNDVKSVAPLGIVPPEKSTQVAPAFSFTVRLTDLALAEAEMLQLRVTQIMGTCLGSDLQVWKGRAVSEAITYRPNHRIDTYFLWPRPAIEEWSF